MRPVINLQSSRRACTPSTLLPTLTFPSNPQQTVGGGGANLFYIQSLTSKTLSFNIQLHTQSSFHIFNFYYNKQIYTIGTSTHPFHHTSCKLSKRHNSLRTRQIHKHLHLGSSRSPLPLIRVLLILRTSLSILIYKLSCLLTLFQISSPQDKTAHQTRISYFDIYKPRLDKKKRMHVNISILMSHHDDPHGRYASFFVACSLH